MVNSISAQSLEDNYIDSLKNVISKTHDDKEKLECLWLWDNEIYWSDEELDFELNERMFAICNTKMEESDTSSNYYFYEMTSKTSNNLGILSENRGDFEKALFYLNYGIKISKEIGDKIGIAIALVNIGNLYEQQGKLEDALRYFLEAKAYILELSEDTSDEDGGGRINHALSNVNANIAATYYSLFLRSEGEIRELYLDTSMSKFKLVIDQTSQLIESKLSQKKSSELNAILAHSYNNFASLHMEIEKYDEAFGYHSKALEISREMNYTLGISSALNGQAKYYFQSGNVKLAISASLESFQKAEESGDLYEIMSSSQLLWGYYKADDEYKLALEQYEQFVTLRDSMNSLSNDKALMQQDYKIQYEKKVLSDSLNFLNQKKIKDEVIEKQEIKLGQERNQKIGLILFSILLSSIALLIYRASRQRKRINKIIYLQKNKVEDHRKKMVDSITYAEKIQNALLPSIDEVRKTFPGLEYLNLPKDIVSGDFFWYHNEGDVSYLALSDCTGHGVPGAFMSIIGANLLKEIISKKEDTNLSEILFELDKGLISLLNQYDEDATADGMDIGIIKINRKTRKIEFAGANQNLYIIDESGTSVKKGDLRSVGGWVRKRSRLPDFTTKDIPYESVKVIYMATDGLEDQLGGPKYTKFGRDTFISLISEMGESPDMNALNTSFLDWKLGYEQLDDISVIGIKL